MTKNAEKILSQSLEAVWASGKRYDFTEVEAIVIAELSGFEGRKDPTLRGNQDIAKMLMMLGEAGIGKTSFWKQIAIKLKIPMRMMNFGEVEVEDNLGIPKANDGDLYHSVQAPPGFPLETPERNVTSAFDVLPGRDISGTKYPGRGIVLFNEVATANPKQESQLRSAISERKIGYNRISDGWLLVADSNPADTKYTTVNKLDHSLESRLYPLPVAVSFRDSMAYWRDTDTLGERMYGFLRLKGENTWVYADNRRWTSTADTVRCMLAAGLKTELVAKFLATAIDPSVGTEFAAYMKFGDDPVHYPVSVLSLLRASEKDQKEHAKLFAAWTKDANKQALLGATACDLREYLNTRQDPLTEAELKRIKGLFDFLHSSQVAEIVSDASAEISAALRELVRGSKHDKVILDMHRKDASARYRT